MPSRCTILVSNSRDFATDYVVAELRARGVKYLRLDTDLLREDSVSLDPVAPALVVRSPQGSFHLGPADVSGILFRAPTHLSESGGGRCDAEEQVARHQWAAFARALTVFEDAAWVNHPVPTYAAECKPFQLRTAARLGWDVLPTRVTNAPMPPDGTALQGPLAMKALDTFYARIRGRDAFFYTRAVDSEDLLREDLRAMPVILQALAADKLDVRATVVGDRCLAASIGRDGAGVEGDWRLQKDDVQYRAHPLPPDVERRCVAVVRELGLVFGAVDLVFSGGRYYFLEVNPTGEWAWLVDRLGLPLPELLTDELTSRETPAA